MIPAHDSTLVDRSGQPARRPTVLYISFLPVHPDNASNLSVFKQDTQAFTILYVTP